MVLRLGRKQLAVVASFLPSAMTYGGAAFVTMLYVTDWKVVVTHIPFYSGKFNE